MTERSMSPAEMYESYFVPAIFAPWAAPLLERAAAAPGEAALDLACGTGAVARRLPALVGPAGRVVAVDLRPGMIEVARRVSAEVDWRLGDATALDLPGGRFDLVTCQQGLQFFSDRAAALREVRRVLRPGGRLAVSLWQPLERQGAMAALAELEARHLGALGADVGSIGLPFSLGSSEALAELLEHAGFGAVTIEPLALPARFADPSRFIAKTQAAYAAVVPELAADPAAFARYVAAMERDAEDIVRAHTFGGEVVIEMHANIALAHGGGE